MRALTACLCALCALCSLGALPSAAQAVRIVSAAPAGPVVEGRPVDIVVETDAPADGARLTFPELRGVFGESLCALRPSGSGGATRFVLRYQPGWPGVHVLQLTVTSGGCGLHPQTTWRLVRLDAAPAAAAADAAPAAACPEAATPPIPRAMRAAREAVVCLVNAERAARGLPELIADEGLRLTASRAAHRPAVRSRPGEQRTVTAGTAPADVMAAWLASEAHARDLLDPAVQRVGVAVVARFPEPLRRPETTYVVELG